MSLPATQETWVGSPGQEDSLKSGSLPWYSRLGEWQPALVFPPGRSHGRRSLQALGRKESDMTELTNTFPLMKQESRTVLLVSKKCLEDSLELRKKLKGSVKLKWNFVFNLICHYNLRFTLKNKNELLSVRYSLSTQYKTSAGKYTVKWAYACMCKLSVSINI